jgi:hypothetical protein
MAWSGHKAFGGDSTSSPANCEEAKKPSFQRATCVQNLLHTHNTRLITFKLDSDWNEKGPVAFVVVRADVESASVAAGTSNQLL